MNGRKIEITEKTTLSKTQQLVNLLGACLCIFPTFGLALLSKYVRDCWKKGIEGKTENKFTVFASKDELSSPDQTDQKITQTFQKAFPKLVEDHTKFSNLVNRQGIDTTIEEFPDYIKFIDKDAAYIDEYASRFSLNKKIYTYSDLAQKSVTNSPETIKYIDNTAKGYEDIVKIATEKNPEVILGIGHGILEKNENIIKNSFKMAASTQNVRQAIFIYKKLPESLQNKLSIAESVIQVVVSHNTALATELYQSLPDSLKQEPSIVRSIINAFPSAIQYLSLDRDNYRELAKEAIQAQPDIIHSILGKIKDNDSHDELRRSLASEALEAVKSDSDLAIEIYNAFPNSLKNERSIALQVINLYPETVLTILSHFSDDLHDDRVFLAKAAILTALITDEKLGENIYYKLPHSIQTEPSIAKIVIKAATENIGENREEEGEVSGNTSHRTKPESSYAILAAAVEDDPSTMVNISKDSEGYAELAAKVVDKDPGNITYIDKDSSCYEQLARNAVNKDPTSIGQIDIDSAVYPELAKKAIDGDPSNIIYIHSDSSEYTQLARDAVTKDPSVIEYIDKNIETYLQIATISLKANPEIIFNILDQVSNDDTELRTRLIKLTLDAAKNKDKNLEKSINDRLQNL